VPKRTPAFLNAREVGGEPDAIDGCPTSQGLPPLLTMPRRIRRTRIRTEITRKNTIKRQDGALGSRIAQGF